MPIVFNTLLCDAHCDLGAVRLLRHKDLSAVKGRTPYELWRDNRQQFEVYQSIQSIKNEPKLRAKRWASFVGTPADETLFVGLYAVNGCRSLDTDTPQPHAEGIDLAGTCNVYDLVLLEKLSDLIGRVVIDWGPGDRAWIQRADRQDKAVLELRRSFKEPDFPGFLNFVESLSKLSSLPSAWVEVLRSSKGVYLLTCPKTKEQYVGSATGSGGFWNRFLDYIETGHAQNVGLKTRDPSDYQISILEVAGTSSMDEEILQMEQRWKRKLQSREMGLNRN
jgi:hypothetical protein